MKPGLLHYQGGYGEIKLAQFDTEAESFVERSWYRESPFEEVEEEAEGEELEIKKPIKTWEAKLAWADPSVRSLVNTLTKRLENEFTAILHEPLAYWYAYYVDAERARSKRFLTVMARKKRIRCRIRVDPTSFKDDEQRTNEVRGWFYAGLSGVERGFNVTSLSEIEKVLPLIRQSYDFVKRENL